MKCTLVCSKGYEKLLTNYLRSRALEVGDDGDLFLVEKGFLVPERGLVLLFDPDGPDGVMDFFEALTFPRGPMDERVVGRVEESFEIVDYEKIQWFEAQGNKVYGVTQGQRYQVREKLYQLEESLAMKGFVRANKSTLVNILHIEEIVPWFNGRLLLRFKEKEEMEVSRNYVKPFKAYLGL